MDKRIGEVPFIELLPQSIAGDPQIQAAATALDAQIAAVQALVERVLIWSRLDTLPEAVIDLLGWQLHVDFWDPAWSLEHKREMVRTSIEAHRHKGTPWAVETILKALGLNARVREWYQYFGEPYKFMLEVGVSDREITPALRSQIEILTFFYKNTRSWLDQILVHYEATLPVAVSAGCMGLVEAVAVMNNLIVAEARGPAGLGLGCVAGVDAISIMQGGV